MSKGKKLYFAPLPPRAIADRRLSALDFRVLACVCLHDRMSGPRNAGQGCWASNKSLAEKVGCDYTRLSATMTRLGQFGYVERRPHPLNKRLRVYVVIYDAVTTDTATENSPETTTEEPDDIAPDSLPDGKVSARVRRFQNAAQADDTVCEPANDDAAIVCQSDQQAQESIEQSPLNIFRETENRLGLSLVRNSAEAASIEEASDNTGAQVAQIERAFNKAVKQHKLDKVQLEQWQRELGQAYFDGGKDDPTTQQAFRVLMEVENELTALIGCSIRDVQRGVHS